MIAAGRRRREWRIVAIVAAVSLVIGSVFAWFVAPTPSARPASLLIGIVNGLLVAVPATLLELRARRIGWMRALRRLPFLVYLLAKTAILTLLIVLAVLAARVAAALVSATAQENFTERLGIVIAFSFGATLIMLTVFEIGALLGFTTLRDVFTGRYVRPREERRLFVLLDLTGSTGLAERLGAPRFHALLADFFRDISDAALDGRGHIHKYVGDEAILTWEWSRGIADGNALGVPFAARARIADRADHYRRIYGVVPELRAAIHGGVVVAGEIGDVRREIAYVGDPLNVAARLLDAARTVEGGVIVSREVLDAAPVPAGLAAIAMPALELRGRAAPLAVAALVPR